MSVTPSSTRPWRAFRRAFLWTLALAAILWSLRAEAELPPQGPSLPEAAPASQENPAPAQPKPEQPAPVVPVVLDDLDPPLPILPGPTPIEPLPEMMPPAQEAETPAPVSPPAQESPMPAPVVQDPVVSTPVVQDQPVLGNAAVQEAGDDVVIRRSIATRPEAPVARGVLDAKVVDQPVDEAPVEEPMAPLAPEPMEPAIVPAAPRSAATESNNANAAPQASTVAAPSSGQLAMTREIKELPGASVTFFPKEDWTVTILPNPVSASEASRRKYEEAYASVPYSRQEYLANPGYRHESAMELLTGQVRQKTVVNQYQSQTIPAPAFTNYKPYMYSRGETYGRWHSSLAPYSFGFPLTPYYPAYPRFPVYY